MKGSRLMVFCTVLAMGAALAVPALAALKVGEVAPSFTLQASLAGKPFTFDLKEALAKGPVVLYFYPKAFTKGCTFEARDFADHMGDYAALHATVIGISHDDIDTLNNFSVLECRNKFAVAADEDQKVAKAYDAVLTEKYDNRTSYVISRDGKIVYTFTNLDYKDHVANTLDALKKLEAKT